MPDYYEIMFLFLHYSSAVYLTYFSIYERFTKAFYIVILMKNYHFQFHYKSMFNEK